MSQSRPYDFVLYGATGFTGRLTARYLTQHAPFAARWALAGRNLDKLREVRGKLALFRPDLEALPLLQADSERPESLQALAESTRVLISTVGPYIVHGEPLVAACAAAGTDYLDLTGEPEFVDLMWLRYHEQATRSGARLVHCCGFDSVPHDLGVYFTVQQLPEGVPLRITGQVRVGGRFSAGTYHSAIHALSRLHRMRSAHRLRRTRERAHDGALRHVGALPVWPHFVEARNAWAVPLPTIDPQIILRSARTLERYGPDFRYGHFLLLKRWSQVAMLAGSMGALTALAQWQPTRRWLLARQQSGDGPSAAARAQSWFRIRYTGEGGGQRVYTEVSGNDPGYGETAKMLGEAALCLAYDELPPRAGQLTPVAAMGDALLARLQAAGILFKVNAVE